MSLLHVLIEEALVEDAFRVGLDDIVLTERMDNFERRFERHPVAPIIKVIFL